MKFVMGELLWSGPPIATHDLSSEFFRKIKNLLKNKYMLTEPYVKSWKEVQKKNWCWMHLGALRSGADRILKYRMI